MELPDVYNQKYSITKDIIGNAALTINDATKSDSGTYKCRIDGTKLVTKCALTVTGTFLYINRKYKSGCEGVSIIIIVEMKGGGCNKVWISGEVV